VRTDLGVWAKDRLFLSHCRGLDVSTTGILLDRGYKLSRELIPTFVDLNIKLPERDQVICAVGRPVWFSGTQQALRLIEIDDVDRLNIAEHIDEILRRGQLLH
jgi:hypothetical protein